jgi:ABC-2 type transport system permease protein
MIRQTLAVARKELRQIVRDRRTLLILLFIPFFFLLIFGYALNFDIRDVTLAVEDRDGSVESRQLVSGFTNSGYFALVATVHGAGEIERMMDDNTIRAALVIPEGFSRGLNATRRAEVQVLINGENASAASTIVGYATAIVRGVSEQIAAAGGRMPPPILTVEPRVWYNAELRSAIFLVPGLITYISTITAIISTALSIVREKERGTMEQVRMAPMSTLAYVLGKTTPYFFVGLASSLAIVVASMWLFGVPMRGSWTLLVVSMSIFLLGALGIGLVISTIADSQQLAFQLALIVALLPTLILSGFIFPIANMPAPIRLLTNVVPAKYFLFLLRSLMLKGAGLSIVGPSLAVLTGFAAVVLGVAARRLARQAAA